MTHQFHTVAVRFEDGKTFVVYTHFADNARDLVKRLMAGEKVVGVETVNKKNQTSYQDGRPIQW